MNQIRMDTRGALLICVQPATPRVKDPLSGEIRRDRETGDPLWQVGVCYVAGTTAEVIRVTVVGEPAGLVVGHTVRVDGLRAIQWEQGERHGLAYRADRIEPAGPIPTTGTGGNAGNAGGGGKAVG